MNAYWEHWGIQKPVFALAGGESPRVWSSWGPAWEEFTGRVATPGTISLITGSAGSGRSTAARRVYEALDPSRVDILPIRVRARVGDVTSPGMDLQSIWSAYLGLSPRATDEDAMSRIRTLVDTGRVVVVIVDGAEAILNRPEMMDWDPWGRAFELSGRGGFAAVFVGNGDTRDRLPKMMGPRTCRAWSMPRVSDGEAMEFLSERLRASNIADTRFDREAMAQVVSASRGNVGRLCALGERCLQEAANRGKTVVDVELARSVSQAPLGTVSDLFRRARDRDSGGRLTE